MHVRGQIRRRIVQCVIVLGLLGSGPAFAVPELKKGDPKVQAELDAALVRQDEMLAAALSELSPQRPGVRDIYFVGVAGWGDQNVFRQEVRSVRSLFEKSFGAMGRAISLVNHPRTLKQAPLANHDTIEKAILGVASKMDPEEDVLVLFITSHGGSWEGVSLTLNGQDFGNLRTAQLARILGASRIRNRVVFVSACYSGQFVPALAEENTLLITAAANDRASFGCSVDAEWTWFGQAYFRDALPKHKRFVPAFEDARKWIEAWEKKNKYKPSVPQIRVGSRIREVLDELGL